MSVDKDPWFLFAGPTLYGLRSTALTLPAGVVSLPPAKRGDIAKLVEENPPSVIVLVDGLFHQNPSVGHRELISAIDEGWVVWGLSSIGAIRARELLQYGMKGFGRVFRMFTQIEDFRDDEVALLHEPGPPYRRLSEPLVNIRDWLCELSEEGTISQEQSAKVIASLSNRWFGDRSLEIVSREVAEIIKVGRDQVFVRLRRDIEMHRIKTFDLQEFLRTKVTRSEKN